MTTRQIEECFELEKLEEIERRFPMYVFDPTMISIEDVRRVMNSDPGKLIRLKPKFYAKSFLYPTPIRRL